MTDAHPAHLAPAPMEAAHRHLAAKALAEYSHERLIAPEPLGDDRHRVVADGETWTFTARVLHLEHWVVDPSSLERHGPGGPLPVDAQALVSALAPRLGLSAEMLPIYLEEIAATLASSAWKRVHAAVPVADLLAADHQQVEAAMTEGHPGFVANNGRIGFGLADHEAYAPEAGAAVRLLWLGVRRSGARLSLGGGLEESGHYRAELGEEWLEQARERVRVLGEDPEDYLLMPVHPWQWQHRLAISFAPDLARRDLVMLGEGPDLHQAQQSIRTFANHTDPGRSLTKVALSIQNMGFVRGLSPAFMEATPAINDWVAGLVHAEPELVDRGFTVLRERAAIGYTGDAYHAAARRTSERSPWTRMTAALWRESLVDRIGEGERAITMAALLHRDAAGDSYAAALIRASGLDARAWVRIYLDAYVRPIVHCLARWHLAFMPHGENVVLVLRDHTVARAIMKDIGEEVVLLGPTDDLDVPEACARVVGDYAPDLRALALHTDVVDGVLRHLAGILHVDGVLDQEEFWDELAHCLADHAADHPELADRLASYDLFTPRFAHSCLNRLQLRDPREMVDLGDQASSLIMAGELANPLAGRERALARA